jgi:hypothetical protein
MIIHLSFDKLQKDIHLKNKCDDKGRNALITYVEKSRNYFVFKVRYKNKSETHDEKKTLKKEMLMASNIKRKNCKRCVATSDRQYSRILILERCTNKELSYVINLFYSSKLFPFLRYKKSDFTGKLKNNLMFWLSESFCRFFFIQNLYRKEYLQSLYYLPGNIIVEENSKNSASSKFIDFTTRKDSTYSLNCGAFNLLESSENTAIEDNYVYINYLGDNLANFEEIITKEENRIRVGYEHYDEPNKNELENYLKASAFDLQ